MDSPVVRQIREAIESDGDAQLADLHVWRVGRASHAAVLTVVAARPRSPDAYRERLAGISTLAHVSVEVNRCPHDECGD
jgi:Co/Zn/Cd efflux system component